MYEDALHTIPAEQCLSSSSRLARASAQSSGRVLQEQVPAPGPPEAQASTGAKSLLPHSTGQNESSRPAQIQGEVK